MSKSKKKIEYRDIDTPASGTWKERVEAKVNAALAHPLMTGSHLRWEQEHFDHDDRPLGPPDLHVWASFSATPCDGLEAIEEVLRGVCHAEYITVSWYYCQDEDIPGCFWDNEESWSPY